MLKRAYGLVAITVIAGTGCADLLSSDFQIVECAQHGDFLNDEVLCQRCQSCMDGEYEAVACSPTADTQCNACDESCATCSGPGSDACLSCPADAFLNDAGECAACTVCGDDAFLASSCTETTDTECVSCGSCNENEYVATACTETTDIECSACHNSCATCSGPAANDCQSCAATAFVNTDGECETCGSCAPGEFVSTSCTATSEIECSDCHDSCATCSGGGSDECLSCASGLLSSGNQCVTFTNSQQSLGTSESWDVELADLNGDGHLDAFVANAGNNNAAANQVWFNDGRGAFTPGQALGSSPSFGVQLGDLNGDGHVDAFVANNGESTGATLSTAANTVWFNDGNGVFTDSMQALGSAVSNEVALADLNGDGHLDAFVANYGYPENGAWSNMANTVWINDGSGTFTDSGQALGSGQSWAIQLADLNGDGSVDAYVANDYNHQHSNRANTVWFNDGNGVFTESDQQHGPDNVSYNVELGDLDGDGDIDAFTAGSRAAGPNQVWFNDGSGAFANADPGFGDPTSISEGLQLVDLDGDNDLDAITTHWSNNNPELKVWLNDGGGNFTDSAIPFGFSSASYDVAVGDLDGDGDIDAFFALPGPPNQVWLQQPN